MCLPQDNNSLDLNEHSACPNNACPNYGEPGPHISVRGRYGKNRNRILLWCHTCHSRFSATKGSPYQRSHLTVACRERILCFAWQGKPIREIARLSGHDKDTVNRVIKTASLNVIKRLFYYLSISQIVTFCKGELNSV